MIKKIALSFKNLGSKFLIVIIALSFAVWGIGDIFVNNNSNPTIAKVGSSEIKLNEFQLDYQLLIDNLRQTNQQPITEELLKALGIQNSIIDNLISKKYINILSKNLDIDLAEKYVKKAIINNPLFNDQLGVFNKDYFNYYLSRNNLKEKDIYNITKDSISNDLLLKSISHSEFVPNIIANNFLEKRDLVRKARIFTFDASSKLISNKTFNDSEIKAKYEKEKSNFLEPETRNISIVTFLYKDLENNMKVSEKELENFYNQNINIFQEDETRNIYVVQFDKKEKINEFIDFFKTNNNFFETLNKFEIDKASSNMNNVSINDFDEETGKEIFKLYENQITKIFETSFGYKIFYLEKINKKQRQAFSDVKEQIKKDLLKEKTNEQIYNYANIFYEKFIETRALDISTENLDVQIKKLEKISLKNLEKNKGLNFLDLNLNEITKIIFNLKKNDISDIIEDTSNNLHYVHLNEINPAKEKSLPVVREQILNLLYDEERNIEAKTMADNFRNNFNPKENYSNLSKKGVTEDATDWVTWDSRLGKDLDINIKNLIFKTKLNNLSRVVNLKKGTFAIVYPILQSNSVLQEDNKSNIDSIILELNESIDTDIKNAILQDMSKKYKSNVNQNFLNSF